MSRSLSDVLASARARLIRLHYESGNGHLGGALSSLEAMVALQHELMAPDDRFVLSKGHAASLLYVGLWTKGLLTEDDLATYSKNGTRLPCHPSGTYIPGLLFPTGSLGHGPSLAAGLAVAARYARSDRRIWCLCSDGEWEEGSCWEALIFAVHRKLDNLTLLIDQNGLQAFGSTEEVASLRDLIPRFQAFGAHAVPIDGHDCDAIVAACRDRISEKPQVVIMQTVKGRGLSTEGTVASHYLAPSREDFESSQLEYAHKNEVEEPLSNKY